jgi:fibronectin-binding autotransporter adhesin
VKNGSGELLLNGTNTYTGATMVNAGSLRMNTVYAGGGAITVADGAVFGALVRQAGVSLNCSSLTLGTVFAGAVTDEFDLGSLPNPTQPVINATNLQTSGTVRVNILGTGLTAGQFTLIKYQGAIGGSGYTFVLDSLPVGLTGSLVNNPGSLDLVVESSIAQTPTNISFALSGTTLELSWPSSHLGWYAQSNSVDVANAAAWFDIPNSQSSTNLSVGISSGVPKVFYRLRRP